MKNLRVIGTAVLIGKITTGETDQRAPPAVARGQLGGKRWDLTNKCAHIR